MLSKLLHYEVPITSINTDIEVLMSVLKAHFEKNNQSVDVRGNFVKGNLGVFFNLVLDGKSYFVKTHLIGIEYRTNLIKEIAILEHLYKESLEIIRVDLSMGDIGYTFLIMDELMPLKFKPDIDTLKRLVKEFSDKLSTFDVTKDKDVYLQLNNRYNLSYIQKKAYQALNFLKENNYLSNNISKEIESCLLKGENTYNFKCDILCHGDLSNKNILLKDNQMIVVDWEDAFLGTEDYDFSYWLTFLDQREYYSKNMLYTICQDRAKCKYFMLLIVTLKCYLSVINNEYMNNSFSFDQRLEEIKNLLA
jgi:hypothetical protein